MGDEKKTSNASSHAKQLQVRANIQQRYEHAVAGILQVTSIIKQLATPRTDRQFSLGANKPRISEKVTFVEEEKSPPRKPRKTQVFLYVRLKSITQLPDLDQHYDIKLNHAINTITKLDSRRTQSQIIDLSKFKREKPTFNLIIEQDSLEDLSNFGDNPLLITLFERVRFSVKPKGEDDYEDVMSEDEEYLKPVAQGYIDLISYFQNQRFNTTAKTLLYPLLDPSLGTCKTEWEVYSLLPPLKQVTYCNIAFITCESLYNVGPEIMLDSKMIGVDFSFLSTIPNEKHEFEKVKICSFQTFHKRIIGEGNNNQQWESLINLGVLNKDTLGVQSGCKVIANNLFSHLLCTEDVDFGFENIRAGVDYALVSNGMHRYVLTKELITILQDVVAFNEQHVLVEVYNQDDPETILLKGTFDLSIFLYPQVNSCRFAVQLKPENAYEPAQMSPRRFTVSNLVDPYQNVTPPKERTTFLTLNICLVTPIYVCHSQIFSLVNPGVCAIISRPSLVREREYISDKHYKNFDEFIVSTISYILENDITAIDDENKADFCCRIPNLINEVMKLIACDLNIRYPTTTNVEFANLITRVYKELERRVYKILKKCENKNLCDCFLSGKSDSDNIRHWISSMKYMYEVGNDEMGDFLLEKMKKEHMGNTLNFYIFLYDTEMGNYDAARRYLQRPLTERDKTGEYFAELIAIYIKYVEHLQNEQYFNEALQHVLENLTNFANLYPKYTDAWILLHCFYKMCSYLPGMSFTRWKYEDTVERLQKQLFNAPISRWEMYNSYQPHFESKKSLKFFNLVTLLSKLGLYKFAEIVYDNIAKECTDMGNYFMRTTFKILLNDQDQSYAVETFPMDKEQHEEKSRAIQAQINGNWQYFCGNIGAAMREYSSIMDIPLYDDYHHFELGLLRYAYNKLEQEEYEDAVDAFNKCSTTGNNRMYANIGMGKAMYKLNRLSEAEYYFAESTKFKFHIPDVWGYLSIVNLKMGSTFRALELWKYAKINPTNVIGEEVLEELRKINIEDIDLYVDMPCRKPCE